jgi:phosphatidylglycerol lysyltransferase
VIGKSEEALERDDQARAGAEAGGQRRLLHRLQPILGLALFGIALVILYRELRHYRPGEIARSLSAIPDTRVALAAGLTVLNFLLLSTYDYLGVRYAGRKLSYPRVGIASFVGFAFSQSLGFPLLTGAPARYRLYSAWGLSAVEISQVIAFYTVTFWIGVGLIGGALLVTGPSLLPPPLGSAPGRVAGVLVLLIVAAYFGWTMRGRPVLRARDWEFPPPRRGLALAQLVVSPLDWSLAAAVLWVLMPGGLGLSYPAFLSIFVAGQVLGLLSHVPGGLGVFEATLLLLLPDHAPRAQLLGALVAFRGIYYLMPLLAGLVAYGTLELRTHRAYVSRVGGMVGRWTLSLAPYILAVATFLAGAVLLVSGATPSVVERVAWLGRLLPLPLIEASHFLASVAGAALLVLGWGLWRRLDSAWHLTVPLLAAGIVLSLLKGLDWEEASLLFVLLAVLVPARDRFYREGSLLGEAFSPGWIAAVGIVLLSSVWLGVFSYRHVEFSSSLWWRFALRGDAPRFLRATVGAVGVTLVIAVLRLVRPVGARPRPPRPSELDRAAAIVASSPVAAANLALLGDKAFLFGEAGDAFLMYGAEGRSWIALGDPVGPLERWPELVWRFRELADRYDDWPVYYQISAQRLPLYLDMGLTLLKLGEEARVPLPDFSLDGGPRRGLRRTLSRLEKEGCSFEIVPAADVPLLLPELRGVSDAWLAGKATREKRFSMGRFEEKYLSRFPAGLVRREGRIVAFTNLWSSTGKREISPDLMRQLPDAPEGVMEYLFLRLMLWGREQGFGWFNLGMAPLSGLENRPLAPAWSRIGSLIYRFGDHFYSFQGLRQYKEKFGPQWEPRYLASPGGFALPRILTNLSSLVSGGIAGAFTR